MTEPETMRLPHTTLPPTEAEVAALIERVSSVQAALEKQADWYERAAQFRGLMRGGQFPDEDGVPGEELILQAVRSGPPQITAVIREHLDYLAYLSLCEHGAALVEAIRDQRFREHPAGDIYRAALTYLHRQAGQEADDEDR